MLARILWRTLQVVTVLAFCSLAGTLTWLKLHESELIFHTAASHQQPQGALPPQAQRLELPLSDGERCTALLLPSDPAHDSGYWVLHLHGNADSAFSTTQVRHIEALRALGLSVLALDYRGFGASAGTASEAHIDEDAEAAWEELIHRGVPPGRIIVWGHSLGSGPAVLLASRHPIAALVLFGAFTSLPDAAADTYPYLPVRYLVSVRFDSIHLLDMVHAPVLIAHSRDDTVIPFHHGQRLYAAAHEPKRFITIWPPYRDAFGGHLDGLYDHLDAVAAALRQLTGVVSIAPTAPPSDDSSSESPSSYKQSREAQIVSER